MEGNYAELMALLQNAINEINSQKSGLEIPIGISNRHIHLSQADQDVLFGPGYEMKKAKDLSQPGQFACKESVTVVGPKGAMEKVRVLGPVRKATQVEIRGGDAFKLGIKNVVRMSGELAGSPGITLVGPKGTVVLKEGVIVAQRHIHMHPTDAAKFGVSNGEIVDIKINSERGGILSNTAIRVSEASRLECHIDTEEAAALGLENDSTITILKK